jgi:hypothetical protein
MRISVAASLMTICATYSCANPARDHSSPSDRSVTSKAPSSSGAGFSLLPVKNDLPISGDVFCAGLAKTLGTMKQNVKTEAAVLCNGNKATALLNDLIATPYTGTGNPPLRQIDSAAPVGQGNVRNYVAYSIRAPKKAVPMLLAEEQLVKTTKYSDSEGFTIALSMDPQLIVNENDCDTAFRVNQYAENKNERAPFTDNSKHDLKFYRLHPDNFDYLAAARTLVEPTGQIKHASIVRGFMPDPADKNFTISFSVVHSIMNGRDFEERVSSAFEGFIASDVATAYNFHAAK